MKYVWRKRSSILFNAWVQVRYNRRRQRFFDLVDKVTKALTVVLGASLMGQFFESAFPWLATLITSLGLLALVFGYSDRKQLHKEIAEMAANLIQSIERVPVEELTSERVANWAAEYAALCAKSPPPLRTLTLICEREQSTAEGYPDHVKKQRFYRRWVADFIF